MSLFLQKSCQGNSVSEYIDCGVEYQKDRDGTEGSNLEFDKIAQWVSYGDEHTCLADHGKARVWRG